MRTLENIKLLLSTRGVGVHEVQQGTAEWLELRKGKVTCSKFGNLFGSSVSKNTYLKEIRSMELATFSSAPTTWGKANEKQALSVYQLITGHEVADVGFLTRGEFVGGSPDGLVLDNETGQIIGGVEIKCPYSPDVHFKHCEAGLPSNYFWQVHGYMWLTKLPWWDFVSFDPRKEEKDQILIIRTLWDERVQQRIEEALDEFVDVLNCGAWFAEVSARAALLSGDFSAFLKA